MLGRCLAIIASRRPHLEESCAVARCLHGLIASQDGWIFQNSHVEKTGNSGGHARDLPACPGKLLAASRRAAAGSNARKPAAQERCANSLLRNRKKRSSGDFPKLKMALLADGALWISWPKAASKVATDLNDNVVREIGLKNGLVDVKVAAVDEVWSGLKFVYRRKDRK